MTLSAEKRREYMREYRQSHPEYYESMKKRVRELAAKVPPQERRNWWRQYREKLYVSIMVGEKHTFLRCDYKRPKPVTGECELCGRESKRLGYHHWDNSNSSAGLWLCFVCHMFAERADVGASIIEFYYELRAKAEEDVEKAMEVGNDYW